LRFILDSEVKVVVGAWILLAVAGPGPENTLAVLFVVAQICFRPCAKLAQILAKKPGRALKSETVNPGRYVCITIALSRAVANSFQGKLAARIAAFKPFVFVHDVQE
jgi:hypothetical protein